MKLLLNSDEITEALKSYVKSLVSIGYADNFDVSISLDPLSAEVEITSSKLNAYLAPHDPQLPALLTQSQLVKPTPVVSTITSVVDSVDLTKSASFNDIVAVVAKEDILAKHESPTPLPQSTANLFASLTTNTQAIVKDDDA